MYDERKSTKIGFPSRGKIKNRQKSAFPHGGKSKIGENRLFLTGEKQKSAKNSFPNIGKTKNGQKSAFPILGRIKKCHWLHFPTLGKTKNPESLLSDFRGSVHFDTSSYFFHKPLQNGVHLNDLKHTPFELISTFLYRKGKIRLNTSHTIYLMP